MPHYPAEHRQEYMDACAEVVRKAEDAEKALREAGNKRQAREYHKIAELYRFFARTGEMDEPQTWTNYYPVDERIAIGGQGRAVGERVNQAERPEQSWKSAITGAALSLLSKMEHEVIRLTVMDGVTTREACSLLGISLATLHVHRRNAFAKMRAMAGYIEGSEA